MRRLPNILSTIRIVLVPIFLLLYIQDQVVWRALSVGVFAVAVLTDFVDGYLARLYEAQSSYGVFLDPLADKFLTFAGFICLPFIDSTQFPWWAVGVIVLRDIIITFMRILADYREINMRTRKVAKFKTMSQMFFLYLVLMVGVFIKTDVWLSPYCRELLQSGVLGWLMIAIVVLTVYSAFDYLITNKEIFSLKNNAKTETSNR
ncbi:MAG TPA: CDP-alcohol phosphatidyltransferase family protein [Balneolaceae bacterium]|nr:CDP-alcohol phosphatidyltransferase family protein [Balneolaceae bacterium]